MVHSFRFAIRPVRSTTRRSYGGSPSRPTSNVVEDGVERSRHRSGFDGFDQEPGVAESPPGLGPEKALKLRIRGTPPPFRLSLERTKGPQLTLGVEDPLDDCGPDRSNQFVLQILDAHVKSQIGHGVDGGRRPNTALMQAPPHEFGGVGIAKTGEVPAFAVGPEPPEVAGHCLGTPDRKHHNTLRFQITSPSPGQRFDRDLIADALDDDDRVGPSGLVERGMSGSNRCAGSVRPTFECPSRIKPFNPIESFHGDLLFARPPEATLHELLHPPPTVSSRSDDAVLPEEVEEARNEIHRGKVLERNPAGLTGIVACGERYQRRSAGG